MHIKPAFLGWYSTSIATKFTPIAQDIHYTCFTLYMKRLPSEEHEKKEEYSKPIFGKFLTMIEKIQSLPELFSFL